jgi:hypothetical protein
MQTIDSTTAEVGTLIDQAGRLIVMHIDVSFMGGRSQPTRMLTLKPAAKTFTGALA